MAPGTYYWSVQTVNAGIVGSLFSSEQSFALTNMPRIIAELPGTAQLVIRVTGEPFQQLKVESSVDMIQWHELATLQLSSSGLAAWTNLLGSTGQQFFRAKIETP